MEITNSYKLIYRCFKCVDLLSTHCIQFVLLCKKNLLFIDIVNLVWVLFSTFSWHLLCLTTNWLNKNLNWLRNVSFSSLHVSIMGTSRFFLKKTSIKFHYDHISSKSNYERHAYLSPYTGRYHILGSLGTISSRKFDLNSIIIIIIWLRHYFT